MHLPPPPRRASLIAITGVACILAISMFGACRKPSLENKSNSEQESPLKKRIEGFYSQMKELHSAPRSSAKTTTAYMTLDSAEFLIETTYNYEVARTNDSAQTEYHGFSFEVPVTNDSLLSETDVSDYMYQIKDSMMVAWDSIAYEAKDLSLFDLEIEHTSGEANATFTVHYSITSGDPIVWDPTVSKTIYGDATGWAALLPPCGVTYMYMYPAIPSGVQNAYFKGVGTLHYTTNSISSVSCSQPGSAVVLRSYGLNNYFAAYGAPSRTYTPINIKFGTVQKPTNTATWHDYHTRGYSCYYNDDQYHVVVPSTSGSPSFLGTDFYALWPNESMMNFYLGYIPTKVHNSVPTGKYLQDFQIVLYQTSLIGFDMQYWYHVYYSDLSDLARNENNTKLPHF